METKFPMPIARTMALAGLTTVFCCLLLLGASWQHATPVQAQGGYALRFFGTGRDNVDRVRIRIDPHVPADIGASDFTIEFWIKARAIDNPGGPCTTGGTAWINGHTIVDSDIFGPGDYGDYGISVYGGRITFGVARGLSGNSICGTTLVADGQWRHIAVTRNATTGQLRIFVDGRLDGQGDGPTGDISYRDNRETRYANDPYLVLGAEKHDAGPEYPSYAGLLDELRLSTTLRYSNDFTPSRQPFVPDTQTAALYHFDEGSGTTAGDATPGGLSPGILSVGGSPAGPVWEADTPFPAPTATPTRTSTPGATATIAPISTTTPTTTMVPRLALPLILQP